MGGKFGSGVEYWAAFNAISMLRFLGINVRRARWCRLRRGITVT